MYPPRLKSSTVESCRMVLRTRMVKHLPVRNENIGPNTSSNLQIDNGEH